MGRGRWGFEVSPSGQLSGASSGRAHCVWVGGGDLAQHAHGRDIVALPLPSVSLRSGAPLPPKVLLIAHVCHRLLQNGLCKFLLQGTVPTAAVSGAVFWWFRGRLGFSRGLAKASSLCMHERQSHDCFADLSHVIQSEYALHAIWPLRRSHHASPHRHGGV